MRSVERGQTWQEREFLATASATARKRGSAGTGRRRADSITASSSKELLPRLVSLAETQLPRIAARLLDGRRHGRRARRAELADDLWQASVACLLRDWFRHAAGGDEPGFFSLRRCLSPTNQFAVSHIRDADRASLSMHTERSAGTQAVSTLFEQLQDFRLLLSPRQHVPKLHRDRDRRRASGSFYTPAPLVEYIVRETVGAAWREHARNRRRADDLIAALATFRLVDPACGGGDFVLSALEFLVVEAEQSFAHLPTRSWRSAIEERLAAQGVTWRRDECLNDERLLSLFIAVHSLHGVDLDPLAVELTRARLWLKLEIRDLSADWLNAHFRCGNALVDEEDAALRKCLPLDWQNAFPDVFSSRVPTFQRGFQAVIGNPPYGATRDPAMRRILARRWPQMNRNSDAVVGFIGRADDICAPSGRMGFVVPKPLTYSFAWHALRETLYQRLDYAIDVSRAWREVLLEQVLLGWRPDSATNEHFRGGEIVAGRVVNRHRAARRHSRQQGTIICALRPPERKLLASLDMADRTVGDICRTFRGLPLQRELSEKGNTRIIGGRDLARWEVRSASGFLRKRAAGVDVAPFRAEKLVFQNIIAHIMRPEPHIRLIGSFDAAGAVTLDTVNNLVARDEGLDLRAVLALLHSRLVNWFVYAVVYNKAIRTMHFDQYFLNKIPLPAAWDRVSGSLAELAASAASAVAARDTLACAKAEAKIDRLVARAYGVSSSALLELGRRPLV